MAEERWEARDRKRRAARESRPGPLSASLRAVGPARLSRREAARLAEARRRIEEEERRAGGPVGSYPVSGQQSLFPGLGRRSEGERWVTLRDGRRVRISAEPPERIAAKYAVGRVALPERRPPESRPGMLPLSESPADPYQFAGQPRVLPRIAPGPARTVPPNWPAREIPYPGSQEPVVIDFPRHVSDQSSHYGEGRRRKVEMWRGDYSRE